MMRLCAVLGQVRSHLSCYWSALSLKLLKLHPSMAQVELSCAALLLGTPVRNGF